MPVNAFSRARLTATGQEWKKEKTLIAELLPK